MDHFLLEKLRFSGLVVGYSAIDTVVDASGAKAGFQLRVDHLRMALVKPPIELLNLLWRQRVYGAFDFQY